MIEGCKYLLGIKANSIFIYELVNNYFADFIQLYN